MEINKAITDLKDANFNVENDSTLDNYLSVNIQALLYGNIKLSKPLLVYYIVRDIQPPQFNYTMVIPSISMEII